MSADPGVSNDTVECPGASFRADADVLEKGADGASLTPRAHRLSERRLGDHRWTRSSIGDEKRGGGGGGRTQEDRAVRGPGVDCILRQN